MDKKKQCMIRKSSLILFAFSFVIIASGCEITKGIAQGMQGITKGFGYTVAGTTKGAIKDTKNLWQAILKADSWIEENLW